MKFYFYFVRKNRASQFVSVRVYFVAFKKFFLSLVRVCVWLSLCLSLWFARLVLVLDLISVAPYPDYTVWVCVIHNLGQRSKCFFLALALALQCVVSRCVWFVATHSLAWSAKVLESSKDSLFGFCFETVFRLSSTLDDFFWWRVCDKFVCFSLLWCFIIRFQPSGRFFFMCLLV